MVNYYKGIDMGEIGLFLVGLAILIVIVISTSRIEKSLTSIEKQNDTVIELLKEIHGKQ
jgi:hypothetical protein